jgi:four helix bundle protein
MGSACELEYHLLLARDLKFLTNLAYEKLDKGIVEIKQMLAALIKKPKADS